MKNKRKTKDQNMDDIHMAAKKYESEFFKNSLKEAFISGALSDVGRNYWIEIYKNQIESEKARQAIKLNDPLGPRKINFISKCGQRVEFDEKSGTISIEGRKNSFYRLNGQIMSEIFENYNEKPNAVIILKSIIRTKYSNLEAYVVKFPISYTYHRVIATYVFQEGILIGSINDIDDNYSFTKFDFLEDGEM